MSTRIQFGVPAQTKVKIVLYNVLGQKVRTYDLGERAPGRYDITWDGMNERGKAVSSGIYFYRFESDKFTQTKKLVLISKQETIIKVANRWVRSHFFTFW